MSKFDQYAFSASPSFNEAATREAFSHANAPVVLSAPRHAP